MAGAAVCKFASAGLTCSHAYEISNNEFLIGEVGVNRSVVALLFVSFATLLTGCKNAPEPVAPLACPPPPAPVTCPEPPPLVTPPLVAQPLDKATTTCPPVPVCPAPEKPEHAKVTGININEAKEIEGKVLLGEAEYATVMPGNLRLTARIDSGATTTSIHATQVQLFERDGKRWVRFHADNGRGKDVVLELPRVRRVLIKGEGTNLEERQVVMIEVQIGSLRQKIEATLSDRDNYHFPLLIGRNFLRDHTLIDVSRKYIQGGKNSPKQK